MTLDWTKIAIYLAVGAGIVGSMVYFERGYFAKKPVTATVTEKVAPPAPPAKPLGVDLKTGEHAPPARIDPNSQVVKCDCAAVEVPSLSVPSNTPKPKAQPLRPHKGEPICTGVPDIAYEYPVATVLDVAKRKGLTKQQMDTLTYCIGAGPRAVGQ